MMAVDRKPAPRPFRECDRLVLLLICAAAFLGGFRPVPAGAAEALVTVTGKTTQAICTDRACTPELRFAVTARKDVAVGQITVRVHSVTLNGVFDGSLKNLFTPRLSLDSGNHLTEIVIAARPGTVLRAGTYDLLLDVSTTDPAEAATVSLTITRAAGQLETPPTLHIERTFDVPWAATTSAHRDDAPPVTLLETSKNSSVIVRERDIHTKQTTVNGATTSNGVLKPDAADLTVASGQATPLKYTLDGDFPLGVNAGALIVTSDQLASPVTINFEVRSHVTAWYILAIVAVGLATSFSVRVRLQSAINRDAAVARAQDLLASIASIRSRHLATSLVTQVAVEKQALESALERGDADDIEAARGKLETAFQAALSSLPQQRLPVEQAVRALQGITDPLWHVAPSILAPLQQAGVALHGVLSSLQSDAIEAAQDQLTTVKNPLSSSLATAEHDWTRSVKMLLADLSRPAVGLSTTAVSAITPFVAAATSAVSGVPTFGAAADTAALADALNRLSQATFSVDDLCDCLVQETNSESADALGRLEPSGPSSPEAFAFLTRVADVVRFLAQIPANPALWANRSTVLQPLDQAWRAVVLLNVPKAGQPPIVALLSAFQYPEAAKAATNAITPAQAGLAATVPALAVSGAPPVRLFRLPPVGRGMPEVMPPSVVALLPSTSQVSLATARLPSFQTKKVLKRAQATQTLVVGTLLTLFGYSMFEAKFVGTPDDFLSIFFWAFGLDLTIDTVLKLTKR
jgi:hypothetical protein